MLKDLKAGDMHDGAFISGFCTTFKASVHRFGPWRVSSSIDRSFECLNLAFVVFMMEWRCKRPIVVRKRQWRPLQGSRFSTRICLPLLGGRQTEVLRPAFAQGGRMLNDSKAGDLLIGAFTIGLSHHFQGGEFVHLPWHHG